VSLSSSHGGHSEIASRLTRRKYLVYNKVARNNLDGALRFTVPQEVWVIPSTRPGFHGRIILLAGPDTVSAGETFTMALMGREPHVTRMGLNTQGVFSDVLRRRLPNGWRSHLPNETYLMKDRQSFDGSGVPPEIRTPFFSPEPPTGSQHQCGDFYDRFRPSLNLTTRSLAVG
jgi:C-terminal processing protease CtpA/Prc